MKKILIFLMVLLLAVTPVLALEGPGTILVGDDNERASNPEAENEGARDAFVTVNFDITNNGNTTVSGLTAVLNGANGFSNTDLNATITFNKDNLEAGEKAQGTIIARLPETLDAIDDKREEEAFHVGDLTVSAGSEELVIPVNMQRENNLIILKVEFCIDGTCERIGRNGDRVEVKPGDDIEVRVQMENRYSDGDSENIDFDDVELHWEIDDNDFDVNDEDDFSIDADDTETVKFNIDVDKDLGAEDYILELELVGKDAYNAKHGDDWSLKIEVERRDHELTLRGVDVSQYTCSAKSITVTADVANTGGDDERDARLVIENPDIAVYKQEGFSIDENDEEEIKETISLSNVKPGLYSLDVTTYYEDEIPSDSETITFTVPKCEDVKVISKPSTNTNAQETRVKELETQVQQLLAQERAAQEAQKQVEEPVERAGMPDDMQDFIGMGLMVSIAVLLLGCIILMLMLMVRR